MKKLNLDRKTLLNISYEILLGVLAFVVPMVLLIILFNLNGFSLAGHDGNTVIMFDMQSEYISFMRELRDCLIHNRSIVYSMHRTFGGEFLPIYCFYLASPFNFLIVFISEIDIPLFFAWTSIIKMALAGLNMYLLLRISTKDRKIGYIAFSIAYGLISYSLAEMHNFMWLDCVMILPLIILGIKLLEEGKHHWLYALTLAYALGTSWYIGALIVMFLIIFFIYRFVSIEKNNRLKFTLRFGVTSLAGGFITALLWLTAFLHLAGTKATGGLPNEATFFPLSMFFTGFLTNFPSSGALTLYSGYATMFTSVVTLVFFQLFFFNKEVSKRERIAAFVVLIIYFFVVQNKVLNAIFHGGQEPTWFPARYSFVIGFFVVYIAALEYRKLDKTPIYAMGFPLISTVVVSLIVTLIANPYLKDKGGAYYKINSLGLIIYLVTILLVACYLLLKNFKKLTHWSIELGMSTLMIALVAISSSQGANSVLSAYKKDNDGQAYSTYLDDCLYQDGINQIKALEKYENYRMELTVNRRGNYNDVNNNPMFYGYNGLNHFSSNSKLVVTDYFQKLGFHNNGFFERYDGGSTLAINSLLGVKYLIDDPIRYTLNKPMFISSPAMEELNLTSSDRELKFYKNNLALPLGFAADSMGAHYINEGTRKEGKVDVHWFNHFEYQNEIFKTLSSNILDSSNNRKDIFNPIEETSFVCKNLTYTQNEYGERYYTTVDPLLPASITYKFNENVVNPSNSLYFCERDLTSADIAEYWLDGNYYEISTYWHKGIHGFKRTSDGVHTLKINLLKPVSNRRIEPELYEEDLNILTEYINAIKSQSSANLTPITSRFSYGFKGTFTLSKPYQTFYFTLPFEKGFKVYVDSKKMQVLTRINVFTGVELKGIDIGKHTIKIVYNDNYFVYGVIVTSIGIASLGGIIFVEKYLKRKKNKQAK